MNRKPCLLVALCIAIACPLWAADKAPAEKPPTQPTTTTAKPKPPEPPAFTTAETAGPDFAIQGEYEGDLGSGKLGAQVIALDKSQFHAVFHKGGLPGAGWDGSPKIEMDGKSDSSKTAFAGAWQTTITEGALTGKTDKGESFTLKRVIRKSPTEGLEPPAGAVVLFNGKNADAWAGGKMDDRKLLSSGTKCKQAFKDMTMHIEFLLPFKPGARGQGRGNSGVYVQDRYEIQVLDSFGLKGLDNECGGIYKQSSPKVNMCFPPLQWQTYDIEFQGATFDAGKKTKNAVLTIKHNGVVIQDKLELKSSTPGGKPETADGGPIQLQGHGNPVYFRNIWVVEKK
ncbi:MAG: DUF1080 domain-containing protein [Candidatus Sumerlaeota bacterium]|nr:DUF1080 domain-containing protein [Candidatus Sumerlaeota bacterium]